MSDPTTCEPTTYGPTAPYATLADVTMCGDGCSGLDLAPAVDADPEADPPVEAVPEGADVALLTAALWWASRRVFLATGQRFFGCTETTIRPCRQRCESLVPFGVMPYGFPWSTWPWPELPYGWDGGFVPVWSCNCAGGMPCSCTNWDRIPLPLLPVRSVTEVKIDGAVVDSAKYAVYAESWLLRIDGDQWPSCQAVELADDQPGTWSVTWRHGLDLPPEAVPLVALYACQLAQRCKGSDCMLPAGVTVAHRDGVDFAVAEPADYRAAGRTGFPPIDDWVALLNGGHVQEPPRIYRAGHRHGGPTIGAI